jgi:hypothetical protein
MRDPDIVLNFNMKDFGSNREELEELHRGDLILFNATIKTLGIQQNEKSLSKYL